MPNVVGEYDHNRFWEYGKWTHRLAHGAEQLDHLVLHGLKPHHYLLDIGCGWLRGGIYFIDYLDIGHYWGFDKDEGTLARGEIILKGKDLIHKKPVIDLVTDTKGIWYFVGLERFDYMLAYSVFTHTDPYMTTRLFDSSIACLKPEGKFFATFHERVGSNDIFVGDKHMSRSDEYKAVKYPFSFFENLAHKNQMTVEITKQMVDDYHSQDWMCFKRK